MMLLNLLFGWPTVQNITFLLKNIYIIILFYVYYDAMLDIYIVQSTGLGSAGRFLCNLFAEWYCNILILPLKLMLTKSYGGNK